MGIHPSNYKDLTGQRFGMLTVIERAGNNSSGSALWRCICDCGNETIVRTAALHNGHTTSCGCYGKYKNLIHGQSHTRLYNIWKTMIQRCENPISKDYLKYGGSGINVCIEWHDFLVFQDWALNNGYSEELTIDRINNDLGYFPDNCRWVSMKEQQNNRRNNILYSMNGEAHTLAEWCDIYNISYCTVYNRIHYHGYDLKSALISPPYAQIIG